MAPKKLLQCVWLCATLIALGSAKAPVLRSRTPIPRGHAERWEALDRQTSLSDGSGIPKTRDSRKESHSVKVKYYTWDEYWMGDVANVTFTSDYEFLSYSHFGLFNAENAKEKGFLNVADMDCAASKPNALINYPNNFTTPSVIRSNATALAEYGLSDLFDIIAVTWKPLGPAPPFTSLSLAGWKVSDKGEKKAEFVDSLFMLWFEDGYLEPATIVPGEYWEGWGEGVNWMEVEARTDEDKSWDFCLDNVVLLFHELEKDE